MLTRQKKLELISKNAAYLDSGDSEGGFDVLRHPKRDFFRDPQCFPLFETYIIIYVNHLKRNYQVIKFNKHKK